MQTNHGGDIWGLRSETGEGIGGLMDFSSSINPEGLASTAREAAIALLNNQRLSAAYPDPCSGELIAAIKAYLGDGVGEDNILVGNGSTELIYLIPGVLKPARVIIVEPAFSEYSAPLIAEGAEVTPFFLSEEDDFALDAERLKETIKQTNPDCLYVANPTNPIGRLTGKEILLDIAGFCRSLGVRLIVDEAFIDFNEACSLKQEASREDNIIVLRSTTKFFAMAALRLGYMVANKGLIERFRARIPTWSVNTAASFAGIASLRDKAYIDRARRWLAREGPAMRGALASINGLKIYPSTANFTTARLASGAVTAPRLRELLIKKGFLIRDLSNVRGLGDGFFRVAVKDADDNRALITALKEVLARQSP